MQKYDNYSTRTFLQSLKWSDDYITFLSVVINQENFLDIGFIEYFKVEFCFTLYTNIIDICYR